MKRYFAAALVLLALLGLAAPASARAETIDSREELFDHIWRTAADKPARFELPACTVWGSAAYLDQIADVLYRSGVEQFSYSLDRKTGAYTITQMEWVDGPIWLCHSEDEVIGALKAAKAEGQSLFNLYAVDGVIEHMFEDNFAYFATMLYRAGYDKDTAFVSKRNMMIRVTKPSYTDVPVVLAENEEEMIAALQEMYRQGRQEFHLLISGEMMDAWLEDKAYFDPIDERAMVTDDDCVIYPGLHMIHYTRLACAPSVLSGTAAAPAAQDATLRTMEEAAARMREAVMADAEEIVLDCTPELADRLLSPAFTDYDSGDVIDMVAAREGILYTRKEVSRDGTRIRLHTMTISPAQRILNGADNLTSREKQLLAEAQKVVHAIEASTDGEFLWALQEALAGRIDYVTDSSTRDDDCAFALLLGRANCDGYADAFDLCAGLAGYETKMISGYYHDSRGRIVPHAWNCVRLGGQWYTVDVTWADAKTLRPFYFLMGQDRAGKEYVWPEEFFPVLAGRSMAGQTPYREVTVSTMSELKSTLMAMDTSKLAGVWAVVTNLDGTPTAEEDRIIDEILYEKGFSRMTGVDEHLLFLN